MEKNAETGGPGGKFNVNLVDVDVEEKRLSRMDFDLLFHFNLSINVMKLNRCYIGSVEKPSESD
jgi:hypothetical protein